MAWIKAADGKFEGSTKGGTSAGGGVGPSKEMLKAKRKKINDFMRTHGMPEKEIRAYNAQTRYSEKHGLFGKPAPKRWPST